MMRRILGGEPPEIVQERAGRFAAVKADLIRLLDAPHLQGEFKKQGIRDHIDQALTELEGIVQGGSDKKVQKAVGLVNKLIADLGGNVMEEMAPGLEHHGNVWAMVNANKFIEGVAELKKSWF